MARVHVLGSLNVDHRLRVARHPAVGETVRGEVLPLTSGGKGLNQAVAAALAGTSLSVTVELHGAVGDDEAGRRLVAVAADHGVGVAGVRVDPTRPTGSAWVVVAVDGANSVVVDPGANQAAVWDPGHARLSAADVVVAQREVPDESVARQLADAQRSGARSILNPSPIDGERALIGEARILVVNEHELAALTGRPVGTNLAADVVARAAESVRAPAQTVVVTLGSVGAVAASPDGVIVVPGTAVPVVDTTGAGDCFLGVLAASLARGLDLGPALHRANRAAARSVQRTGAVDAMPTAEQIDG